MPAQAGIQIWPFQRSGFRILSASGGRVRNDKRWWI